MEKKNSRTEGENNLTKANEDGIVSGGEDEAVIK